MMHSRARPISAFTIPGLLLFLGLLPLAIFFDSSTQELPQKIAAYSYVSVFINLVVLAGSAILLMTRRLIGRTLYCFGMPVVIVFDIAVGVFATFETEGMLGASLLPIGIIALIQVLIYGVLVASMYRLKISEWLVAVDEHRFDVTHGQPIVETDESQERVYIQRSLFNKLWFRVSLFVFLLLVLVFIFGAPIEILYFMGVVLPLGLLVRFFIVQKSKKIA